MANGIVGTQVRVMVNAVVLLFALLTGAVVLGPSAAPALAADAVVPAWAQGTVSATGSAVTSDDPAIGLGERRLAAQREAKLDAVQKLTEQVHAIDTGAGVTVGALVTADEKLRGPVDAFVQGARLAGTRFLAGGRAEVTLEIGLEALPTILGIGE